jgi:hypothetical protein
MKYSSLERYQTGCKIGSYELEYSQAGTSQSIMDSSCVRNVSEMEGRPILTNLIVQSQPLPKPAINTLMNSHVKNPTIYGPSTVEGLTPISSRNKEKYYCVDGAY